MGTQISLPKTKLMAITPNPTNHLPLKICNKEVGLLFVDSFTYLGLTMYRALVVSVLLDGSEALATTLADRRRLDVFDRRCQRRLLRVFWQQHIGNQSIRERTKQPATSSLLRQRRLRWLGHLHRMPSSLPVRRVFDFNPNIHGWKIPRGRPKTRWANSIKHDLSLLASTPPMLPRWSLTDPSGKHLLVDCQRPNTSKVKPAPTV